MRFSVYLGYTGGDMNISDCQFIVNSGVFLSKWKAFTLAQSTKMLIRISGLYGNRQVPIQGISNDQFIEALSNYPAQQIEVANEFIRDDGSLAFTVDDLARWVKQVKSKNKYTILSEFKPWDDYRWGVFKSVISKVKPDGVGIQLHLKYNYNAEIVLLKLPSLILSLQDRGVDVHFTECSVWQHKNWLFGDAHRIWDSIFKVAEDLKVKSVTPWLQGDFDGQFIPSFGDWVNVKLKY